MILIVDNYDSFTYNLAQAFGQLGADVLVRRNDQITVEEAESLAPAGIVISPGPGRPDDAGVSKAIIRRFAASTPILGVCLGHQCIAEAFGGKVTRAPRLMHGKTSPVLHRGSPLYAGVPSPFQATRYHSLIVDRDGLPDELEVASETPDGEIMGIAHRRWSVEGVQFHPESILTEHGMTLMNNFIRRIEEGERRDSSGHTQSG